MGSTQSTWGRFFFFLYFFYFFFFLLPTTSKRKKFLHNGRRQPKARLWVDKAVQRAGDSRGQRSGDVYLDRRNWRYSAKQNSHSGNGASYPKRRASLDFRRLLHWSNSSGTRRL